MTLILAEKKLAVYKSLVKSIYSDIKMKVTDPYVILNLGTLYIKHLSDFFIS